MTEKKAKVKQTPNAIRVEIAKIERTEFSGNYVSFFMKKEAGTIPTLQTLPMKRFLPVLGELVLSIQAEGSEILITRTGGGQ